MDVSSDEGSSLLQRLDLPTDDLDSKVVELSEKPWKVGSRGEGESGERRSGEVATEQSEESEEGKGGRTERVCELHEFRMKELESRDVLQDLLGKFALGESLVIGNKIVVPCTVDVRVVVCCFGVGNPREGLDDARGDERFKLEVGDSLPCVNLRRGSRELMKASRGGSQGL